MRKLPRVLILWGVPGTGKSTFAKYLVEERSYLHIDTDLGGAGENKAAKARHYPQPVVIEYGMFTDAYGLALLGRLRDAGADVWWFDGDRAAAFAA